MRHEWRRFPRSRQPFAGRRVDLPIQATRQVASKGDAVNKTYVAAAALMAGMILATSVSYADAVRRPRDPGVNARQHHQRDRIQQGVRSGELTRREAGRLAHEQRDIRQLEREYRSDGALTGAERRDLHQEQNQASQHIYHQKHDAQERPGAPAAVRDPGVNQRQANQTGRIAQGVVSGELTKPEAQELRAERRDIRQLEQDYKSDGALTRDERQDLHRELNQQSREIYEEKHDEEVRPSP
jgi:Skp family chaperone for outer membrane proteins